MFEKILAKLPYDPEQINKMAFYARRLKQEKSIRRIGFLFVTLAFVVQFFAVINPPQPTVASSSNDLVNGGFSSAAQAASYCTSNVQDYASILNYYGITCAKVAAAQTITINSRDWNNNLWSMGRNDVGSLPGETPVGPINGNTYYVRYLWGWDAPGTSSSYQALNVTTAGGQTFLLLYNCGNIVSVGFPNPVSQPPAISINKITDPGWPKAESLVKPGTEVKFRIMLSNNGGKATNVNVKDPDPQYLDYIGQNSNSASGFVYDINKNQAIWHYNQIDAGVSGLYTTIKFKVNDKAPNKAQICNYAKITGDNFATQNTGPVCFTVDNNAPVPPPTPDKCPYDPSILVTNPLCVPCPNNNKIIKSNPKCKPCEKSISSIDAAACVIYSKQATNITQNISNANGTLAQPNDVIKYTLTAKNSGSSDVKNFVFQDNLAYILIYSKVVNTNGGVIKNNSIVYPPTNLAKGTTKSVSFVVKIDNPIPQTPVSTSDPGLFNLTMTNTYGNTIKINLPPSPQKQIENTAAKLPNTGPGNGIMIATAIAFFAGFFYYRTRLLAEEASIVTKESTSRSI